MGNKMKAETLVMINEEAILNKLKDMQEHLTVTTKRNVTLTVRAVIDGEAYVSAPGSDGVFKLDPKSIPTDMYVAQAANKKLTEGLVKKPSTLVYHNGKYYQCVTDGRQYRPLTGKTNIVG